MSEQTNEVPMFEALPENTLIKNFRLFDLYRLPWLQMTSLLCVTIIIVNYMWSETKFKESIVRALSKQAGILTEEVLK